MDPFIKQEYHYYKPSVHNTIEQQQHYFPEQMYELVEKEEKSILHGQGYHGHHHYWTPERSVLSFRQDYLDVMDNYAYRMGRTVQSVEYAVDKVFGNQIRTWSACMHQALQRGEVPYQPNTSLDTIWEALRFFTSDSVVRQLKFAVSLPGVLELDMLTKRNITVGWKWLTFWLQETFVKIGPLMEYHWTNKWQHSIAEPELLRFFQQFLKQFKEIGLTQTEHYLLLIVIMLEPVRTMRTTGSGRRTQGELIHKYYGDVLIHTLKRRIADPVELASTCRKITELFGTLGLLNRIHRYYLRSLTDRATPSRAVANERTVTVQEAISYGDHGEPVEESEEFNFFSPMTFNPRLVISTGRNSDSRLPDFQIASENET